MIKIDYIDRDLTLQYLAHHGNPDNNTATLMDECEKALLKVIAPKYTYRVFDIDTISDDRVTLKACSLVLNGRDISAHLDGCTRVVLFCATIGAGADKLVRTAQIEDMAKAVIIDTMGSVSVEQVCDIVETYLRDDYKRYNMTWRFSAGYGDLPIEIQKDFLDVLNTQKNIGVTITDSMLMTPKKSVSAIIGMSKNEINRVKMGCAGCNMKDTCSFRKRGIHCD